MALMSAAVESDPLENRWFAKRKTTQRIDPAVALCMAIGAATMAAPIDGFEDEIRGVKDGLADASADADGAAT